MLKGLRLVAIRQAGGRGHYVRSSGSGAVHLRLRVLPPGGLAGIRRCISLNQNVSREYVRGPKLLGLFSLESGNWVERPSGL